MRALTLYQPWAQGIALGLKRVETRPRRMNYRGTLLIHAALKWAPDLRQAALDTAESYPEHREVLSNPPRGAVVAVVRIHDCKQMTEELIDDTSEQERAWGDWRVGRYAIYFDDIAALPEPVPARGKQGIWIPTDDVLFKVMEQL